MPQKVQMSSTSFETRLVEAIMCVDCSDVSNLFSFPLFLISFLIMIYIYLVSWLEDVNACEIFITAHLTLPCIPIAGNL